MAEDTKIYETGHHRLIGPPKQHKDDVSATLRERETTHGDFSINACMSQRLKEKIRQGIGYSSLNTAQCEALDMICTKIGRIVNGNPNHADNWHDIAGYATLVERMLVDSENSEP